MPTRLLSIASTQAEYVMLHDTLLATQSHETQIQHPYAALSYCWGDIAPRFKLTKECIDEARNGILVKRLPRTLQDAILIARTMGTPYIWIDSLCIIQDDEEDKKRELPKMVDIYSGAAVVISAAASKTCEDGFLQPRDISSLLKSVYKLAYFASDDGPKKGFVMLSEGATTDMHDMEHIDQRCWTLQEHIQAVATLRFGSRQVRWSCQQTDFIDGGIDAPVNNDANDETFNTALFDGSYYKRHPRLAESLSPKRFDHVCNDWMDLVEHYASRSLSNPNDVLPAFSAVPQTWARLTKGQLGAYWAGLWEKDLPRQLLWHMSTPMSQADMTTLKPSWSWACCPGRPRVFTRLWCYDRKIEIVDCTIELLDPRWIYGSVVSGILTVKGRTRPLADLSCYFDRVDENGPDEQPEDCSRIRWDVKNEEESRSLWCLEVVRTDELSSFSAKAHGLVLFLNEDGTFNRAGYYEHPVDWLTNFLEMNAPVENITRTITIV
jgi:hypothetical protein